MHAILRDAWNKCDFFLIHVLLYCSVYAHKAVNLIYQFITGECKIVPLFLFLQDALLWYGELLACDLDKAFFYYYFYFTFIILY